jgi:hypothetical protein
MRVPIRMISVATTIFWIFLIAFAVSAVYSVRDVSFSMGEPQSTLTQDNVMILSLPFTVANKGFYNIGFLSVSTEISDEEGYLIASNSTMMPVVRVGEQATLVHNVALNVTDFLWRNQNYLFDDALFLVNMSLGMRIAEVIPVQVSTNVSMPWGAPFYNFSLGMPEPVSFNSTHLLVTVPLSFENHAFFDVASALRVQIYNVHGSLVSDTQTSVNASQHSSYNGFVEFYVPAGEMTNTGRFEVLFLTLPFDSGQLEVHYG